MKPLAITLLLVLGAHLPIFAAQKTDNAYDEAYFRNSRVYTSPLTYKKGQASSCREVLTEKAYKDIQYSHPSVLPDSIFTTMK